MIFADLALARRLEEAETVSTLDYEQTKARLMPEIGCAHAPVGDGLAVFVGPHSPINRVHNLAMRAPANEEIVAEIERFYDRYGVAPRIDLCPLADATLQTVLMRRGYGVQGFKQIWWRALTTPLPPAPDLVQEGSHLRIEIISGEERLLWAQAVSAGFSGLSSLDEVDITIPYVNAHKAGTLCFMAWVGDTPAGGGALAIHDRVAICFSAATRPAFRRLGVQDALLRARLAYAAAQDCELAAIGTTPGSASQRNVERLGFRLAYTKPTMVANVG